MAYLSNIDKEFQYILLSKWAKYWKN